MYLIWGKGLQADSHFGYLAKDKKLGIKLFQCVDHLWGKFSAEVCSEQWKESLSKLKKRVKQDVSLLNPVLNNLQNERGSFRSNEFEYCSSHGGLLEELLLAAHKKGFSVEAYNHIAQTSCRHWKEILHKICVDFEVQLSS